MTCVIAHRGASAAYPENTVAAFVGARELGADWVELDVRRTADGELVVLHDAHLPDGRAVVELGRKALPAEVPSLVEALDACAGMGVNVEVKNSPGDPDFDADDRVAEAVATLLGRRDGVQPVLVSSFNLRTVDRVRADAPGVPTAWLTFDLADADGVIDRTVRHGHRAIHPLHDLVDRAFVRAAQAAGLEVNVWTVDDPARMVELAGFGVDGIVTNVPDVARRVLTQTPEIA